MRFKFQMGYIYTQTKDNSTTRSHTSEEAKVEAKLQV
jgi:hypothetical protein